VFDEGLDVVKPGSLPLDKAALRGVPCIGRNSGGSAIAGTLPHVAILRLDDRKRRRL
jgi:hypothetical protein